MTAAIDVVLYLPTIAAHLEPYLVVALVLFPFAWPWVREVVGR